MDNTDILTQAEQQLFDAAKSEGHVSPKEDRLRFETTAADGAERAKEKYQEKGVKLYEITADLEEDDDTEVNVAFLLKRPSMGSYDRYIKTVSTSMSKASRAFVMDNIIEEQRELLKETLEEYPALAISISGKLLSMLGLADSVAVKKA